MTTISPAGRFWGVSSRPRYPDFAARLRDAMERAQVTPATVERVLGVDNETVRLWRKGDRMPRDQKIKALAKLLGVPAGFLQHGDRGGGIAPPGANIVTDEDELDMLTLYRRLEPWGRKAVRARAVELIEAFQAPGPDNPFGKGRAKSGGTQ